MPPANAARAGSRRFLNPQDLHRQRSGSRAWSNAELFSDGQWQVIRVALEAQGWTPYQIELIHDQLRQGWPLPMARSNVASLTGQCPLRSQRGA